MTMATEGELNQFGYQLMGRGEIDRSIAVFERNNRAHPESWNTYDSLAEVYANHGDKEKAIELYKKALEIVDDEQQKTRIESAIANLQG